MAGTHPPAQFRPDAAGNLVAVSVIKAGAANRGTSIWRCFEPGMTRSSREHDVPVTLERAAQTAYHNPDRSLFPGGRLLP